MANYINISDNDLVYDRSRNISGVALTSDVNDISGACGSNGSSVTFRTKDYSFVCKDKYLNVMPIGVNNIIAEFNMLYEIDEANAQSFVNFLESKEGVTPFVLETDATIYKDLDGVCKSYSLSQSEDNSFNLTLNFEVSESATHFNWRTTNFLRKEWNDIPYKEFGHDYKVDDIVYDARLESPYQDKINNFFYCTKDHNSSDETAVNSLYESEYWTQDFWWLPDSQNVNAEFSVVTFGESDGFKMRRKVEKNAAMFPLEYEFRNINTKRLLAILHFLEMKAGFRRFKHRIGKIYNRPKVFICRSWRHSWNSLDDHTLNVRFEEDPIGVFPARLPQTTESLSSYAYGSDLQSLKNTLGDIPNDWVLNRGDVETIKIGNGCANIGNSAFRGCFNLQGNVTLNVINVIGNRAFEGCTKVKEFILPVSLTSVGNSAFKNCTGWRGDLIFPNKVNSLGDNAFEGCLIDGDLKLNPNLQTIGISCFERCKKLTVPADDFGLYIPEGITTIPQKAFSKCESLDGDLIIPSSVTSIGDYAFFGCNRLSNTIILESENLTSIGTDAFIGCNRITDIVIRSKTAPTVNTGMFSQMKRDGNLLRITIPPDGVGYDTPQWTYLQSAVIGLIIMRSY